MDDSKDEITCTHCGKRWNKKHIERSCSNCFACTGCEASICAGCRYEIVVVPVKQINKPK